MQHNKEGVEPFVYSGKEELDNMALMVRYNYSIVSLIKKYAGNSENILDFGAGIGTLAECFDKDKIICLEIDQAQKKQLKKKGFRVFAHLNEVEKNSLSFVYSSNVLEHIEDDYKAVRDIYSKMTSKARILFYVPAFPFLYSSMDKRVGHYRRYTKSRLRDVFKRAGFIVEDIFYRDSLGFFATIVYQLIGSKEGTASKKSLLFYDRFLFPISCFLDHIFSRFFGKNIVIVAQKK